MPSRLAVVSGIVACLVAPHVPAQSTHIVAGPIGTLDWQPPDGAKVTVEKGVVHYDMRKDALASTQQHVAGSGSSHVVMVRTRHVSGVTDWPYGLNFAGRDYDNEYFFLISADGSFKIGKFQKGQWGDIQGWTQHDAIQKGPLAVNRLMVDQRATWKFYVNDVLVHSMPAQQEFGHDAGIAIERMQQVDFEDFYVGEYFARSSSGFSSKLGALVDDVRSDFAHSRGKLIDPKEMVPSWTVKDPLPGLELQQIEVLGYNGLVGRYATQADAIDALLKLKDGISGAATECILVDYSDLIDRLDRLVNAPAEVIHGNTWSSIDELTHGSSACRNTAVQLHITRPSGASKTWDLSLGVFRKPDKKD